MQNLNHRVSGDLGNICEGWGHYFFEAKPLRTVVSWSTDRVQRVQWRKTFERCHIQENNSASSSLFERARHDVGLITPKVRARLANTSYVCPTFTHQNTVEWTTLFYGSLICSSILEYDAEGFMKLSLLFQVQGFFCIVHSKCVWSYCTFF